MPAGEEGRRGAGTEHTGKGTTEQVYDTREHMTPVPTALPSHPCAHSPLSHTPVAAAASWPDSKTTCGASALFSFMHAPIVCVGGRQ
jgi:hypothetical protein